MPIRSSKGNNDDGYKKAEDCSCGRSAIVFLSGCAIDNRSRKSAWRRIPLGHVIPGALGPHGQDSNPGALIVDRVNRESWSAGRSIDRMVGTRDSDAD